MLEELVHAVFGNLRGVRSVTDFPAAALRTRRLGRRSMAARRGDLGRPLLHFMAEVGRFGVFAWKTGRTCLLRPPRFRDILGQMNRIGVDSLTIVNVCAIFTGIVLTLQTAYELMRFGAHLYISRIVGIAFLREIGPVFTALMIAGRIGSGIAAELGSMQVTEQVDALRAMGADPIRRLVAPRVIGTLVMVPTLTLITNVLGIAAGLVTARVGLGVTPAQYMATCLEALIPLDLLSGLVKGACFGLTIGLIATFVGLETERTTEAVGRSTTKAMVTCAYAILIGDFVITKSFFVLMDMMPFLG
jgi:phospholipid/cholesterol/gamma-HCH transport system permease protein